jgi:hypothetical protein
MDKQMCKIEVSPELDQFLEKYSPEFEITKSELLDRSLLWVSEYTENTEGYFRLVLQETGERVTYEISKAAYINLRNLALQGRRPVQTLIPIAVTGYVNHFAPSLNPLPASAGRNVVRLRRPK